MRSEKEWRSNQAFLSARLRTVTCRRVPVGKTNLVVGRRSGSVVVVDFEEEDRGGKGKGVEINAFPNSGPEVEVPCRRMRVWVCVWEGGMMWGGG